MLHGTDNSVILVAPTTNVSLSSEQWDVPMNDGTTQCKPATPRVRAVIQFWIMCPPNSLLSKNGKIKTHDTTVLPLVLY